MLVDQLRTEETVQRVAEIRRLDSERSFDLDIARKLDKASLEALNPFDKSHNLMTDDELRRWMADGPNARLRTIVVDGQDIGFVYLYNDANSDPDYRQRAQVYRKRQHLPDNQPVWEMNFWVPGGTADQVVKDGVSATLEEFAHAMKHKTVTLMFVSEEDRLSQDTRVLNSLGFSEHPTMVPYELGGRADSWEYAKTIHKSR